MRKKKLILNTITSFSNQIITMICGFILPKLLLENYGSEVNGLVSSITQFLGFITFMELGIGAVVQSALYKPLSNKNEDEISKIIISAERFFKKLSVIMVIYTIILAILYPIITKSNFGYLYSSSLIVVISISALAQYYFGITYQLLLNADQKSYVQNIIQIISLIINTIATVLLIRRGNSIQIVKLATSIIYILRPLAMILYVKKNYHINKDIVLDEEPIKQKWNGLAQHLASVILNSTDIVVLTLLSSLKNVSIYTIYNLVVIGVKQIITSLTNGMASLLGNMLARKEIDLLNKTFDKLEFLIHFMVVLSFTCTGLLIIPFVQVYTKNISDINYIVPTFAYLITLAQAAYCLRLPYNIMVLAAGHYKQTQLSAIIEMIINVFLSVLLVIKFGLIGVAIGTFIAMAYRTVYLALYLKNNIIKRKFRNFIKHIIIDLIIVFISILMTRGFEMSYISYSAWIILALKVGTICLVTSFVVNLIAYKKLIISVIRYRE